MQEISRPEILTYNHPYGYRVNINHPDVLPLWLRFKQWKGIPVTIPASDDERLEFEAYLFENKYIALLYNQEQE